MKSAILASVPIDAPDGRRLWIDIRGGQAHDLVESAWQFAQSTRLDTGYANSIAAIAEKYLPPVVFRMPITGEGRVM